VSAGVSGPPPEHSPHVRLKPDATNGDQTPQADHYSYRVYADPAMANGFDALRFSGPIGTLVAEEQARVLAAFAGDVTGRAVIDVGTGTGRAAIELAARGARVTGVDASEEMLRVARERAAGAGLPVVFEQGDAHALPFGDGVFDAAVCLRVLMHAPDWRRCLRELCRVSRERVVFDYPALRSAAALQAAARRVVAAGGGRTEAYRVFAHGAIARELAACGYRVQDVHRHFVLPIAVHKAVGSRSFTQGTERALAALGLLRLFGSPVTIVAVRCESS
jgi:ubiquinone/menaquinone biosynthesis C-methylase UbiE